MTHAQVWGWAATEDSDGWDGPFENREAAELHGAAYAMEVEDPAALGWVAEGEMVNASALAVGTVDMERMLEQINEDESCSWADEPVVTPKVYEEAEGALIDAIGAWADKYLTANNKFHLTGEPIKVGAPVSK